MLVSLKNSSSVESLISASKLKMLEIEFRIDRKMHPSMESHLSILLLKNLWRKIHKIGSPSSYSYPMSSSQVSSDTMLFFHHVKLAL